MEYYSVIRRWTNLRDIMLCEINQSREWRNVSICEIFTVVNLIETDSRRGSEEVRGEAWRPGKLF